MVPPDKTKQAIYEAKARGKAEERIKTEQKLKAFGRIIGEILDSRGTLFKTEAELKEILDKKIKERRKQLKQADFTPKEIAFLNEIILLARRDNRISCLLCDPLINNSMILGGFAGQIHKLCEKKLENIDNLSKTEMKETLSKISRFAEIILEHILIVEDNFNNHRGG